MMEDFNSLQSDITKALLATTRSASELADEDLTFYRALDSSLGPKLDHQNARLLALSQRLLGAAAANTEAVRPPSLSSLESVDGNWKAVVDVVDSLLERADTALDEFTGAIKRLSPGAEQAAKPGKLGKFSSAGRELDIRKPQLHFEHVPSNQETRPFKPLLLSKPHASVPLETHPIASDPESQEIFPHPYQLEIEQYRYPTAACAQRDPIPYHAWDSTTAIFVDTEEALEDMLKALRQANEIAIDLEHHDNRSFIGIVSLMQISTRDQDWIVDTLRPWRRKLQCLNEVFADPGIVKVLHGAYMDIIWLQRDFGLYLVGLFDTFHAAKALGYAGGSLAFLLKKFANVEAQKQYQMADWRVRPLPQELFDYARSDTHYLLYIFDCMRNELIDRSIPGEPNHEGNLLLQVLQKSSETALQRYEHPMYDSEYGQGSMGWFKMLSRTPALFSKEQFAVFRAVHQWRDQVAREQDDSLNYVLPNHHIFTLAKAMPTSPQELLNSLHGNTQTVRLRVNELLAVISKGKEAGSNGPEMMDFFKQPSSQAPQESVTPAVPPQSAIVPSQSHDMDVMSTKHSTLALPLRSTTSSFWGSAFASSVWTQKRNAATVSLSAPLPPLTAEIFAEPAEITSVLAKSDVHVESGPIEPRDEEVNDTFVLKELGQKRKRDLEDDSSAAPNNGADVKFLEGRPRGPTKTHEIKSGKRGKSKKSAQQAQVDEAQTAQVENEPFDYAKAPNLLSGSGSDGLSKRERRKREKQLNPYAKALDTAKGLPRAQKEKPGKSVTYKS